MSGLTGILYQARHFSWRGVIILAIGLTAILPEAKGSPISESWWGEDKNKKTIVNECMKIALAGKSSKLPENQGVKTLCTAIADAWKLKSSKEFNETLNVLKVSFGGKNKKDKGKNLTCKIQPNETSVVDPGAVARLLSVPGLLPAHYSGGLALHGLKFKKVFALYNATVDTPVAFVDSAFCGGDLDRETIGLYNLEKVAIFLNAVQFKKRFLVSGGIIKGDVIISSSKFEDSLAFIDINKNEKNTQNTKSNLIINYSIIERSLVLQGGVFTGSVKIGANFIFSFLVIEKPKFIGDFRVFYNEIGLYLMSGPIFFNTVKINENQLKGPLGIYDAVFRQPKTKEKETSNKPVTVEIGSNQVGDGFVLTFNLDNQARSDDKPINVEEISLESNRVQGDALVSIPAEWWGTINLTNFSSNAGLWIEQKGIKPNVTRLTKSCTAVEKADLRKPPLTLNLALVNVRILNWDLPISCDYRWSGNALRYENWEPNEQFLKSGSYKTRWGALMAWRHAMVEPSLDALNYMADHLKSRGRFSDSREVLEHAKKMNYTEGSVKNSNTLKRKGFFSCLGKWDGNCLKSYVLGVMLYPGGYGAVPERTLLWIVIGWFIFGFFYKCYSWYYTDEKDFTTSCKLYHLILNFVKCVFYWPYKVNYCLFGFSPSTKRKADRPEDYKTEVPGFLHFSQGLDPAKFGIWRYSLDAMLPVINLHAYDRYFLKSRRWRWVPVLQHLLGWWWITVFLASATIL